MISTQRRLEYFSGFIQLGLLDEAAAELEAVVSSDRFFPEVLLARIELHMETKAWDAVIELSRAVTTAHPARERAWITLAFALREQQRIAEARDVLLAADVLHGAECALLHYNLACYYSLLGDQVTAKERLRRACKMDKSWKVEALHDTDLSALWGEIPALE